MATATLIPVEEYLRNSWSPDREYVDGVILERNLGELPHSHLQTAFWSSFRTPPYIVVEILSPEDRVSALTEKIDDYLDFGIPNIWVVDPARKAISSYTRMGSNVFAGGPSTSDGLISVPPEELFAEIPDIQSE